MSEDIKNKINYTEQDFETLEWHEHIRRRPGMYLGKLGDGSTPDDGLYILIKEALDNAVDEFHEGFGKLIELNLDEQTNQVTIRDYGRGIPLGKVIDSVSKMNTGSKFQKDGSVAYGMSVGLNGVGMKAVNATSTEFYVQSFRDGKTSWAKFEKGILVDKGDGKQGGEKDGTLIKYIADNTLYVNYKYNLGYIDTMLKNYSYLNTGLTIKFNGTTYLSRHGLLDLINDKLKEPPIYEPIRLIGNNIEIVLTHCNDNGENIYSFVNGQYTFQGGTHLSAFRESLAKVVKDFYQKDYDPKDIREGIVAAISIRIGNPDFANQTKTLLNSLYTDKEEKGGIRISRFIYDFLAIELDNYFHQNLQMVEKLQKKILANEKERKDFEKIRKGKKSKRAVLNNEALRDCKIHFTDKNPKAEQTTLFITEGKSASGSVTNTRDVEVQAVFSLRGKPKNTFGKSRKTIYDKENVELNNLQSALDIEDDIDNLRYNRVVIATDADVDGMHIRMLLITFFLQYYPELIRRGHLYILQTPLFRVRKKRRDNSMDTRYCYSEKEKNEALKSLGVNAEITRFKGLGEIDPSEFSLFIGEDIKLDQVRLDQEEKIPSLLEFYMGGNTEFRRQFIMDNLREDVIMEDIISTGE